MQNKNQLFLFWKIGQGVFDKCNSCENVISKYSSMLSYLFGMSNTFSIANVNYMKKFYCCFPFYYKELNTLSFEQYKLLVDISDIKRRYFYFRVGLFCRSSFDELEYLINNDFYNYI